MLTIAPDGVPYRCRFCHQPVAIEFGQGIAASGAIRYFELDEKTVHQCRERKASNTIRAINSAESRRKNRL